LAAKSFALLAGGALVDTAGVALFGGAIHGGAFVARQTCLLSEGAGCNHVTVEFRILDSGDSVSFHCICSLVLGAFFLSLLAPDRVKKKPFLRKK